MWMLQETELKVLHKTTNISCLFLTHWAGYFIAEGYETLRQDFPLPTYVLTIPNHLALTRMASTIMCSHALPGTEVRWSACRSPGPAPCSFEIGVTLDFFPSIGSSSDDQNLPKIVFQTSISMISASLMSTHGCVSSGSVDLQISNWFQCPFTQSASMEDYSWHQTFWVGLRGSVSWREILPVKSKAKKALSSWAVSMSHHQTRPISFCSRSTFSLIFFLLLVYL